MNTSLNLLRQLAACSKDIIFVYDCQSSTFPFLNATASTFFESNAEDIQQNPELLLSLIQPEDKKYVLKEIQSLREGKRSIDIECRLFTRKQKTMWLQLKAYILEEEPGGNHIAGIAADITQRKELELSLITVKEQKNVALQIVGHDLRAPLNNIAMTAQVLEQMLEGEAKDKAKEFLDIINSTCRNSLTLIGEILNAEFIEAQELGVKLQRLDLISRIQQQLDTFQLSRSSNKKFTLNPSAGTVYAITDPVRFELIMENLLTNAYKFTKNNGEIKVGVEEKEELILISVADNGIGIPDKFKPMVFDKFTKARRQGQQGEKPVGLGLHLVRTMVDQLGGHIWFESQEGNGTTFFVELPKKE